MAITNEVDQDKTRLPSIGGFIFWTDYEPDPENPQALKEIERVSWTKVGDPLKPRVVEKIARLMANPAKKRPAALEWPTIEPAYKAWKSGKAIPIDGTPLAAWPGCDQTLAEALRARGVLTVEQFAGLADHLLGGIGLPDARRRQEVAKAFLTAQKGEAVVAAELSKRDAEIAELRRMVEQLTAPAVALPAGAEKVTTAPQQRAA